MTDAMRPIEESREHDERSAPWRIWARRAGVLVLVSVPILALLNVFGQRADTTTSRTPSVAVSLHAPDRIRAGLLFQAKISIIPHRTLKRATLVLGNGWLDGITLNTNEPQATSETAGPDGGLALSLGTLQAGHPFVQYLEFQVNPTSLGSRPQPVTLQADGTNLLAIHHTMTVIP